MNRIIEAFTRAHDQVTGIDQIIMTATAVVVVAIGLAIYLIVAELIDRK